MVRYSEAWQNAIDALYNETIKQDPTSEEAYEVFNDAADAVNKAFSRLGRYVERRDR